MDKAIINPAAIQRLSEWGGENLLGRMVNLFLENTPARMDQIRRCLDADPGDQPLRGAHSLKSSAANLGADDLRVMCQTIEDLAAEGKIDDIREMLPPLEEAFSAACGQLEDITRGIDV